MAQGLRRTGQTLQFCPKERHPVRFTFAEAPPEPRKPAPVLTWIGRVVNLLVIGGVGWAVIETAAFIHDFVVALTS